MFTLKLIKGLSYCGVISATKDNPYVEVADEATAIKAVASGFFEIVGWPETAPGDDEPPVPPADTDTDVPPADDDSSEDGGGDDGQGDQDSQDDDQDGEEDDDEIPDGIIGDQEDTPGGDEQKGAYGGKLLKDMLVTELETFAAYKNVSLQGITGKKNIIKKLQEALGPEETDGIIWYGSPTMTELQQQVN